MSYLVTPKPFVHEGKVKMIYNRSTKRPFAQEAKEILLEFDKINTEFLDSLFSSEDCRTYDELYEAYCGVWKTIIEMFEKAGKLESTNVNKRFFKWFYAPNDNGRKRDEELKGILAAINI